MSKKPHGTDERVYFQNAIKTLVANIRFTSVDSPVATIVVTSSIPNEGKTSISIALAEAFASSGKKVLLMECDMRRRSVAAAMGLHARSGIYAVLSGQTDLSDAAIPTNTRGLYFLDAEPHIPNPVDIYASKRFASLVERAKRDYDYVIFDTPPLSSFVDAAVIGAVADGTLIVCRQDFVKREELLATYDQLQKAGARVIGTVLNFCESDRSEYYYSYYNKDGKKVRKRDASTAPAVAPAAPPRQAPKPAPAPAVAAPAAAATDAPRRAATTPASKPAAAAHRQAVSAPEVAQQAPAGLRSLGGSDIAPDSTAQFLAGAGYAPRSYDPDE